MLQSASIYKMNDIIKFKKYQDQNQDIYQDKNQDNYQDQNQDKSMKCRKNIKMSYLDIIKIFASVQDQDFECRKS